MVLGRRRAGKGAHLLMHNLLLLPSGPLKCHGVEQAGAHFLVERVRWEVSHRSRLSLELLLVLKPTCCGEFCGIKVPLLLRLSLFLCGVAGVDKAEEWE